MFKEARLICTVHDEHCIGKDFGRLSLVLLYYLVLDWIVLKKRGSVGYDSVVVLEL